MVAHALLTVCCAKKPGKSDSNCPAVLLGSLALEGSHLKRNMRAWRGCRADSASGSREYKSSTMYGTPSDFRSSLIFDEDFRLIVAREGYTYVNTPGSDSVSSQPLESPSDMSIDLSDW